MAKDETPIDKNSSAAGGPGWLMLADRMIVVRHPTPADWYAFRDYCKSLAREEAQTPIKAIADDVKDLPPDLRAEIIREAVAQSKGKGAVEPTEEAVKAKADSYEAITWFLAWLAKESQPDVTVEFVRLKVNRDELFEFQASMAVAMGKADDPKASCPAGSDSGSGS